MSIKFCPNCGSQNFNYHDSTSDFTQDIYLCGYCHAKFLVEEVIVTDDVPENYLQAPMESFI